MLASSVISITGLVITFVGAVWAARALTTKRPKGAPSSPGGGIDLYFDPAQVRQGLWMIGGGTLLQIIGAVQAAVS